PAVLKTGRGWSHLPRLVVADPLGLWQETQRLLSGGQPFPAPTSLVEQFPATAREGVVQFRDELQRGRSEDLVVTLAHGTGDLQPAVHRVSHVSSPSSR